MNLLLMILFLTASAHAHGPKEGFFHGSGKMNCNFINGRVTRPNALTWEIRKVSQDPLQYEVLGGISTINSVPLHFMAKETEWGTFDLLNEASKKSGTMNCTNEGCHLKYNFITNFIQNLRVPQTITADWVWNSKGFTQRGKLRSLIPYVINCDFVDQLVHVD